MGVIALDSFGGQIPRAGKHQLPNNAAIKAQNCLLLSGELRPLHKPTQLVDVTDAGYEVQRVFRVLYEPNDFFVPFPDKDTYFLKSPLVNDTHDRYYWTTPGIVPQMSTADNLKVEGQNFTLGVPAPTVAPTLTPSDTGTDPLVTRAYVYTFVSFYSEEGPPSPPVVASGTDGVLWTLDGMEDTIPDIANRAGPFTKRVYRTVTGTSGAAEYFFVAEVAMVDTSYADTESTEDVSLNSLLESNSYSPPPEGLDGLLVHPNGFLVGFVGRDIHFSEPYRPHAWPPEYFISTEFPIVGFGVYGTTVVVLTEGFPSRATGVSPASMALKDSPVAEPCLSRYGIQSMPEGVYFPGANGLMLINASGIVNASRGQLTKDEWQLLYFPKSIQSAQWQGFYVAFTSETEGFIFSPGESMAAFVEMTEVWHQTAIQTDPFTSEVLTIFDDIVYVWNPPEGVPLTYTYRTKEFHTPKPVNLGAYRIYFDSIASNATITEEAVVYNDKRLAAGPLNTFNQHAFNAATPKYDLDPFVDENKMPGGGNPLINIAYINAFNNLVFRVYGNGVLRHDWPVFDEEPHKLPTGYKADRWEFEFEGNTVVRFARIATTGTALADG
jgi:hypothetical protein